MNDWIVHFYNDNALYVYSLVKFFLIVSAICTVLTLFFNRKRSQPILRRGLVTDSLYFFLGPIAYFWVKTFVTLFLATTFVSTMPASKTHFYEHAPLGEMSQWVQIPVILLLYDFMRYWVHRASHVVPVLWKFHAVHHSSVEIDWLSVSRFHPVNLFLQNILPIALIALMGFDFQAIVTVMFMDKLAGILEHCDLPWTFGPFRYVLVNPVYHRWHHTHPHEGGNKNYSGWFPFIDMMFGTFYMPEEQMPKVFGTANDMVPDGFFGQLIYPFRKIPPQQ